MMIIELSNVSYAVIINRCQLTRKSNEVSVVQKYLIYYLNLADRESL